MKVNEKIKKEVIDVVQTITSLPEDKLAEDAKFIEDLGIDSMMALEIVAATEKKFRVVIPEEEIPKTQSLRDIYNLLEKLLK